VWVSVVWGVIRMLCEIGFVMGFDISAFSTWVTPARLQFL
jgi:hypothetical protein